MTLDELMEIRSSREAPFDHDAYTVWLHNQIVEKITYDIWKFREEKSLQIPSTYAACTNILMLPSIKRITRR